MNGSGFLLQRVCCLHSSQHYTQETKSHSLARYFPKDWYCMFQSELAELTLWVAIKIPRFLSLVGQIGLSDNLGPLPWKCGYASMCWLTLGTESTESPAEGGNLKILKTREGGEWGKAKAELFWIDYLQVVCQQPEKQRAGLAACTVVGPVGLSFEDKRDLMCLWSSLDPWKLGMQLLEATF